ncbi:MAG: methyl-accepting chemotaxis sensory transducer [uncultured bacterium]|nr:MAG: methyl-accepting chemotaxis sensory transducer [uncultured bacterium]
MDFDGAIKAHAEWKMKLSAYLSKKDGSLKAADVSPDNKCALGQWIHGEGAKFQSLPEYAALKAEHANFHKAAADIIKKADSGQNVSGEVALGAASPFAATSQKVVVAIMAMKSKAK